MKRDNLVVQQEAILHYFIQNGVRRNSLFISITRDSLVEKILQFMARGNEAELIYCHSITALGYTKDPKYHGQRKIIDI